MMGRAIMVAIALSCVTGCGLSHTVDSDLLSDISVEYKLILFDAENDLGITIDERDNIVRQIREAKRDVRDTYAQLEDASSDEVRASKKGDAEAEKVADFAQSVIGLKLDYLGAKIGLLRERLLYQEGFILVAQAKYELAKAKLVKKNNVRGASDIELSDFEAQVDSYVEDARGNQQVLAEELKAVEARRLTWLAQREQLLKASGGGAGSQWAEDSTPWGAQ